MQQFVTEINEGAAGSTTTDLALLTVFEKVKINEKHCEK